MITSLCVAVDAMGGDSGSAVTIPAVLRLAPQHPHIQFRVYGEKSLCSSLLPSVFPNNIHFHSTGSSVCMSDSPVQALRHKRDSSMAACLLSVADNVADACISAGNTGALVAMGMHFLKTYQGINRPALCQAIPTAKGHSYLLDLGANIECSAEQLVEFARLGAALSALLDGNAVPTICLLNIGSEDYKGTPIIQEAAKQLLQSQTLNYQGFIEGDQLYQGLADIIVCDGFTGNIALKTSEGVSRFVTTRLRQAFRSSFYGWLVGLLAKPLLYHWQANMNPDRYNGAYLLGLQGAVVKSHGGANIAQFTYALEMLIEQLQRQTRCSMAEKLADFSLPAVSTDKE